MILRTQAQTGFVTLLVALCLVMVVTAAVFLLGRHISAYLGRRGLRATEKLMGLLLNLVAVNMVLVGVRDFLVAC